MYKKRLLIASGIITTVVIALVLFLLPSGPPKELMATDLVAANLQFTHELNQADGEVMFFTGSSIAKLNVTHDKSVDSNLTTKDLPLNDVDKISHSRFATVVRSYYKKGSLLPLDSNDRTVKSLREGRNWFIIDNLSRIRPVPFANQTSLVDCIIDGQDIYAIVNSGSGKQKLIKYNLQTNKAINLTSNYPASSFVGASNGSVVFRDYAGNVYLFKDGRARLVEKNVGEASFDSKSGALIISHVAKESVGAEGGVPTKISSTSDDQNGYQLTIFNVFSEVREQVSLKSALFFVSKGYILSVPSLNGPTSLSAFNLNTSKEYIIKIDQSNSKVVDQIKDLVVINQDLSLIGAITNFDQLVLYGTKDLVSKIPQYDLPKLGNNQGKFSFDYSVGTNTLLVNYRAWNTSVVADSIASLKQTCGCDTNQIAKRWQLQTPSADL